MSHILSLVLLAICVGILISHFIDIKKTNRRNG